MTALRSEPSDGDKGRDCPHLVLDQVMRRLGLTECERLTGHADKWAHRWLDRADPHHLRELQDLCRAERERLGTDDLAIAVSTMICASEEVDEAHPLLLDDDERELRRCDAAIMTHRTYRPTHVVRSLQTAAKHYQEAVALERRRAEAAARYLTDYAAAIGIVPVWRRIAAALAVVLLTVSLAWGSAIARRQARRRDNDRMVIMVPT